MSRAWSKGSTRAWRLLRARVLADNMAKQGGVCQAGVAGVCTGRAEQVHHTLGKQHGDDPRYLKAVCKACNLHIGNPSTYNPQPRRVTKW